MELKFLYRPEWVYDPIDKRWMSRDFKKILHYRVDTWGKWRPVESEQFPSPEDQERLIKEFPAPNE